MATSARQYAQSLYEAVADKGEAEIKAALKNFVGILGRRRELAKAAEIIVRFSEIWNQEKGELEAELASARSLGSSAQAAVTDYLKNKTGADTIRLNEKIDHELIGGFRLRYQDRVIDGSLRSSLRELGEKMSN